MSDLNKEHLCQKHVSDALSMWYDGVIDGTAKSRENLNQYVLALIRGQTDHRRSKFGIFKASDQKRPNWSFDETRGNLVIHAASSPTCRQPSTPADAISRWWKSRCENARWPCFRAIAPCFLLTWATLLPHFGTYGILWIVSTTISFVLHTQSVSFSHSQLF